MSTNDARRRDLTADLQRVEKLVRADLLAQYRAGPALMARARARLVEEEASSVESDREAWLQAFAGRAAVLYLLKTVYVRVLEDQGLLAPARIRDGGGFETFKRLFPRLDHAAYLHRVFADAARALPDLFAPTPVEIAQPSDAAAREVWTVWQAAAPGGGPRHDFRGDDLDTRFVGDLYQDLDADVRARYALLQTPDFIEEFILDRTLELALADFGLDDFRMIDPTCGSGHFLLGAFARLAKRWRERLGDDDEARFEAARRALAAVHGVDLNEYACALTRFRLLLAVVRETGVRDLARLGELHPQVIACDALIPWERAREYLPSVGAAAWLASYGPDKERERNEAFFARGFHAVVGNPPYIAVKDKKKRETYRLAWKDSASGKYSLSAPMTERFLRLPVSGGRSGIIVANNFCKRSFGKGVIEKVLRDARLDLVVDSSGAYIPGHGTPTVMLFATNVKPNVREQRTRVVAGKRGEPREPEDPARGIVWSAIIDAWDRPGYEDTWIAVQDLPQETLTQHPWSLGSDAVSAIKATLDAFPRLADLGADAGPAVIIIEDEAFVRRYARALPLRPIVFGEDVRDWKLGISGARALHPYNDVGVLKSEAEATDDLWSLRSLLSERSTFVGTFRSNGRPWWEYERNRADRLGRGTRRIVIGEVATNAHFVVDDSDSVFTRTAPVLTLREADEAMYCDVASVLNSSTLEFWFKQVCFERQRGGKLGEVLRPQRYKRTASSVSA